MSFSFRNIFSPDEGDIEGLPAGFEQPTGAAGGGMSRSGWGAGPAVPEVPGQDFLISELIAFIPPAISAQSGIPMSREVRIPLPADGSRDVKLSTIYQICPELFAAEITPLNDSTVTLPPKLGAMGATGFSLPVMEQSSVGFAATATSAGNPFRTPSPSKGEEKSATAVPGDGKAEPARSHQEETSSVWPKESAGGLNPFAAQGPAAQIPGKGNAFAAPAAPATPASESTIPGSFDAPTPAAGGPPFLGGFSGSESRPAAGLFGGGAAAVTNEAADNGGKAFPGNPFESGQGFNTLFSKQAEVDREIPFPTGSVLDAAATANESVDEPEGVWGAMFQGGGFTDHDEVAAETEAEVPFPPPAFESIGNLLKQGNGAATAPAGFPQATESAAPPAPVPMTPTSAIPAGFSAFEPAPVRKEPTPVPAAKAPPVEPKEEPLPASGFPAFSTPPQTFAGFGTDTIPTPSPMDTFANDVFSTAPRAIEAPTAPAAPVEAAPAPAKAVAPVTGGANFEMRDLELRAIFSTSETFTLSMVVRRVVGLPGIVSCSLSTPGKLVQASKSEEGRIGNEAREMVATLRSLAKLTGLPEARTFTLHTDRGIVSLFLEGECCVMVHHENAAFEPGVREKLILVARNLIHLEE